MKTAVLFAPVALALALLCNPLTAAAQENPWPERAAADLRSIRDRLAADHPGPVLDPDFAERLEVGLTTATAQSAAIDDVAGYIYLLMSYVNGLPDNHLAIWGARDNPQWAQVPRDPTAYPGFITAWRDGAFVVRDAIGADPIRNGMRLVSCDGAPIADLAESNLFTSLGKADQPADWARFGPLLLIDQGVTGFRRPDACTFIDGEDTVDAPLHWREVAMQAIGRSIGEAGFGAPPALGARLLADGGLWVSLPSFLSDAVPAPVGDQVRAALQQAQGAPYLVFDLRANSGGNSILADSFAAAAFGEPWVAAQRTADNMTMSAVYLRASDGNRAFFVAAGDASSGGTRTYFDALVGAIDTAIAAGDPLASLGGGQGGPVPDVPDPAFGGQVFVLTDGNAFSSTLLFIDLVLRHPNARHVGWPTRAHGLYGELRQERLPSGWAWLAFSTKAFTARTGSGNGLIPEVAWTGEIDDTPALEAWIQDLVASGR